MISNLLIIIPFCSAVFSFNLPNLDISSAVDLQSTTNSIVNSRISTTNFSISLVACNIFFSIIILFLIALSYKRMSHPILRLSEEVARLKRRVPSNVNLPKHVNK